MSQKIRRSVQRQADKTGLLLTAASPQTCGPEKLGAKKKRTHPKDQSPRDDEDDPSFSDFFPDSDH